MGKSLSFTHCQGNYLPIPHFGRGFLAYYYYYIPDSNVLKFMPTLCTSNLCKISNFDYQQMKKKPF